MTGCASAKPGKNSMAATRVKQIKLQDFIKRPPILAELALYSETIRKATQKSGAILKRYSDYLQYVT